LKKFISIIIFLFIYCNGNSQVQVRFSFATDFMVMRNFSPKQKFWAIGQTISGNLHFSAKETIYASVGFLSEGSFDNQFTATAKSSSTIPTSIVYNIEGKMRSNQVSIGWKHFWWGNFNSENAINIYSLTGFGIMFGHMENIYSKGIDTGLYDNSAAPVAGEGKFKRLTLDLGVGIEYPIGGTLYIYSEVRTSLPTTNFPSEYLHSNEKVPSPLIVNLGLRMLFGYD
jgi:hypothetical protein